MSTLKTIGLQHLNGTNPNIYLGNTGSIGVGSSNTISGRAITLDNPSNYYGVGFSVAGVQVGQIIQEATGNIYIDAGSSASVNTGAMVFRTNLGTERMRINSSGYVTTPYQPVFAAVGGTSQSWSGTAAYQTLQLKNQYITTNSRASGYSTSTYRFTAPVAGMYMFFGKITQSTAVGGPSLVLFVNGAAVYTEMTIAYNLAYMSSSGMWPYYMNAGDFAELRVTNYNNVSVTLDLTRCNFIGWLLG